MSKREVLLNALTATPSDLERLLKSVDDSHLTYRPTPDEWSIADVLCHLVMVEQQGLTRLQRMVTERPSTIPAIYPDAAMHDLTQPTTTLLINFRQARQTMLAFLRELKAGDWQVTAVHPTLGNLSVRSLVQHHVDHDTAHLNQIVEIRERELASSPISNLQSPP
ncbi:MAG TPA: DinB family protein [Chloroflexota bacterium]|nr:DinB family protein [Chloroflexota bacterium]